ncbi:MAG: hypothetical protein GTN80_11645 [Nitrososphaeria archaeon]|nr:hypothetical protein [Nitrososphaeria archaeon]
MSKDDMTDPITKTFHDLTEGKYHHVDRKLFSYVDRDQRFYRYPIHFEDIKRMPDEERILSELKEMRGEDWKINKPLPKRSKDVSFAKYYASRIGDRLYDKFMRLYTLKMWGYSGDDMPTDTTFADQLRDKNQEKNMDQHDPMHFEVEVTPLAEGTFCVYPTVNAKYAMGGYNAMFDKMVDGCEVRHEEVIVVTKDSIITNGDSLWTSHYDHIFNTLAPDLVTKREPILRAMGRIMIPFIIPEKIMEGVETIYYPGYEFQTRLTNMDRVTGHENAVATLLTMEIPVYPGTTFPAPMLFYAKDHSLYCDRAYPDRRKEEIEKLMELRKNFPDRTIHCGRMAEWQYMGMSEVMRSAYEKVENL